MKNKKIGLIALGIIFLIITTSLLAFFLDWIDENNKAKEIAIATQDELRQEILDLESDNLLKISGDYENAELELGNTQKKYEFIKENKKNLEECVKTNTNNMGTINEIIECNYEFWSEEFQELKDIIEITKVEALEPEKIFKKPGLRFNGSYEVNGWLVNSAGLSQSRFTLEGNNPNTRTLDLVKRYGFSDSDSQLWLDTEDGYGIMRGVLVCISKTDSSLGKALKTQNNFGNVGNTDSGATRSFATAEAGIKAMGSTLNNRLLGYKQSIGSLSRGGGGSDPIYATSIDNWNNNTINCLRVIYQDNKIDENFLFRK